jgi:hypothetical protein
MQKPIDMAKASGVLLYSVVNRGNGNAAANADGRVSLVSGWQGDVTPTAANQTMQLPIAKNPDGSRISGPFVTRWMAVSGKTQQIIMPRNEVSRYPPTTLDTSQFTFNEIVGNPGRRAGGVVTSIRRLGVRDAAPSRSRRRPARLPEEQLQLGKACELFYTVTTRSSPASASRRATNAFFKYQAPTTPARRTRSRAASIRG